MLVRVKRRVAEVVEDVLAVLRLGSTAVDHANRLAIKVAATISLQTGTARSEAAIINRICALLSLAVALRLEGIRTTGSPRSHVFGIDVTRRQLMGRVKSKSTSDIEICITQELFVELNIPGQVLLSTFYDIAARRGRAVTQSDDDA